MQKRNFFTEVTFLCSLKIIAGVFERMSFLTKCNFGLVIYEAISYNGEQDNKEEWNGGRKQPAHKNVSD